MASDWTPAAGDRVALIAECEDGPDPARVGTVIDASAVDGDGQPMVGVDFPFTDRVVVLPPSALQPVDDRDELGYLDSPKLRAAYDRIGEALGVSVFGSLIAASAAEDMTAPEGLEAHRFTGRTDRPCTMEGCGKPDRNPIHHFTPPYRMRYLTDLGVGDRLFLQDKAWTEATVLDTRDDAGHAWLIVVDSDGDQRGLNGHRYLTVPVPL